LTPGGGPPSARAEARPDETGGTESLNSQLRSDWSLSRGSECESAGAYGLVFEIA